MENKINIAELLKDCPSGMELDCTMFDDVTFEGIKQDEYPIIVKIKEPSMFLSLTKTGCWNLYNSAKCVIFPKGKTTWEGFVPPCNFKDGDILSYQYKGFKNRTIYIYMQHSRMNTTYYVALSGNSDSEFMVNDKEGHALNSYNDSVRLATEEEKSKLFQAIKDNGYKWNSETKTLEKLLEPKFKVGDRIVKKNGIYVPVEITSIDDEFYYSKTPNSAGVLSIKDQDNWELAPNKFGITTLKPFDKVLVRLTKDGVWNATFFSHYDKEVKWGCYPFITTGSKSYPMCIPYNEDTKYLLGTTNDCDEFYKTR